MWNCITTAPTTPRSPLPAPFIPEVMGMMSFLLNPTLWVAAGGMVADMQPVSQTEIWTQLVMLEMSETG